MTDRSFLAKPSPVGHSMPEWLSNLHLFTSLDDVREATWWRMHEYNEERPHDSLDDQTPREAYQAVRNSTFQLSP